MLNLSALQRATLAHDPFDHVIVDDFVPQADAAAVSKDFPVIPSTGSFPLSELSYGPAFAGLIEELNGAGFEQTMASAFGLDLSPYARVHTDAKWKIISVLLYLNREWTNQGGRLRLLRGEDVNQTAVEVMPRWGTLLAFRRSDRSWHGHLPAEGERRVVQINWVTSQEMADKELRRHKRSAWLKRIVGRRA